MNRLAILVDGGHLRVLARIAQKAYNPDYVERIAHACVEADEQLLRVLYYDCAPYNGDVELPVSQTVKTFDKPDTWLLNLAKRDLIAVRRGLLKFRGWKPKAVPVPTHVPTDADFEPLFEQKGVDMRIGLDVAAFCVNHAVDRIALITNDTDCVPAMKYARKAGIQTVLITFPNGNPASELVYHSDFRRAVAWPV
jgi:uncharacterized LabA/DUF88 family protein